MKTETVSTVTCDFCSKACIPTSNTPGYGQTRKGKIRCFECCGEEDKRVLREEDLTTLYLVGGPGKWMVNNWPGTLNITPLSVSHSTVYGFGRRDHAN